VTVYLRPEQTKSICIIKECLERNNIKKLDTSAVRLKDKQLKIKYILRESLIVPLIYFVD